MWPPPEEGASRLPNTGSASAYPCAEDIIARFVEFGKVRNCLPPPRGKVPPQGADEGGSRGCGVLSRKSLSFVTASPRHLPPRVGKAKENPPAGDGSPRRCAPRNDGELGIDFFPYHVILKIKRGAAGRREPLASYKEVTVKWLNLWRLLLFIVVNMDEQSQNAHDELTDQDQFRMSHHMYHLPPRKRRLYKRSVASSRAMRMRGLPPTEY